MPLELRLGPVPVVLATTAEMSHAVMIDDATFDKGGLLFDKGRESVGNGLFTCARSDHRRQRRLLQPAFHPGRIPGYVLAMTQHADRVTASWRDADTIDAVSALASVTSGIAMDTMFTPEPDGVNMKDLFTDVKNIAAGTYLRALTPGFLNWVPIPAKIRYKQAIKRLRDGGHAMLAQRRSAGVIDRGDLLSIMLTDTDSGDAELSDDEVIDQILTFFFGGIETTTTLLCWSCDLLARHPEIQLALQQEADQVLGGRAATYADTKELKLTRLVVLEALRLYPPGWLITRRATCPAELGGYHIPQGTIVAISPYLLAHRPDRYPASERFDPYRWDNADVTKMLSAFLPFSSGPRKCIGDVFGLTEAVITISTIASRWHLHPAPRSAGPKPALGASTRPKKLDLRVTAR